MYMLATLADCFGSDERPQGTVRSTTSDLPRIETDRRVRRIFRVATVCLRVWGTVRFS